MLFVLLYKDILILKMIVVFRQVIRIQNYFLAV